MYSFIFVCRLIIPSTRVRRFLPFLPFISPLSAPWLSLRLAAAPLSPPFLLLFHYFIRGKTVNRKTLFIRSKACFHLLARDYPPLFEIENTTWTRASDSDFLSSLSRYRFSFFFFSFLPFYHFLPNYRAEKMELP